MEFEAVYYAAPAPNSMQALTLLALVFDRVIFPSVYIAADGIDLEATERERERVSKLRHPGDENTRQMLNLMVCAMNARHLKDFCRFTGELGSLADRDPEAGTLTHDLETLIYGPPPENFSRETTLSVSKGLPGNDSACIATPSWLSYPAHALLYAARTGTVLVNDNPHLPVLSVGSPDMRSNAKQLATILALESVRLVLPPLRALSPPELAEFREETKQLVQPFRRAMLKLSKDLHTAIASDAQLADVQREARFLVETTVGPELDEMKEALARPPQAWYRWVASAGRAVPEIAGAFATMPWNLAIATSLTRIAGLLADVRDSQLEREGIRKRGGFHYLLKIGDALNEK
jgi:hypothetical protein